MLLTYTLRCLSIDNLFFQITAPKIPFYLGIQMPGQGICFFSLTDPLPPLTLICRSSFCIHPGPCTTQTGCLCAKNNIPCQKRCRCQCPPQGCQCNNCDDECPCAKSFRECNPEGCKPRKEQVKEEASVFKHHSSFGLGSFASKDIPQPSLLGEYISEAYPTSLHSEKDKRQIDLAIGKINRQRGLNYLFSMDQDKNNTFDAATVGDPTRYLNNPLPGAESNVYAAECIIDGDCKIIFQTMHGQVKCDEELLLDYGSDFWIKDLPSEDEEDPNL
ncbi:hypothetical protein LXA43DRAFT_170607 [Ganoderma leucocontextum]|nr:hypothetical protein LXA43DRAFT_170607 [Ganoderma leucocontextum]